MIVWEVTPEEILNISGKRNPLEASKYIL